MNTEEWKSIAFSLLGLVSGLSLFTMTRNPLKVYVQSLQRTTLFKKITDDMTRFSKEFPLRAYTYPNE